MKTAVFYPYCGENLSIAEAGVDCRITAAVMLPDTGNAVRDTGEYLLLEQSGITIEPEIKAAIDTTDLLLVSVRAFEEKLWGYALTAMEYALQQQKEVLCAAQVSKEQKKQLSGIDRVRFLTESDSVKPETESYVQGLIKLFAPVVFVGGLFGLAEEAEVAVKLVHALREKGIKVSGMIHSNYAPWNGLHITPEYLMRPNGISDDERVIAFNHYVAAMEYQERPDLIVIQLPDGMMKFDDHLPNSFGICSYLISRAVSADYFICCCPNDTYGQQFWKAISQKLTYQYGFPVDCVHLANLNVLYSQAMEDNKLTTYRVPMSAVHLDMQQPDGASGIPVYNLMNDSDFHEMLKNFLMLLNP